MKKDYTFILFFITSFLLFSTGMYAQRQVTEKITPRPETLQNSQVDLLKNITAPIPQMAAGDGTILYGSMVHSKTWATDSPEYGVYSFPADDPAAFTLVKSSQLEIISGIYLDGKYFILTTNQAGDDFAWYKYDAKTWAIENIIGVSNNEDIVSDITYDPVSGNVYAITYSEEEKKFCMLSTYNLTTGKASPIGVLTTSIAGVRYRLPLLTLAANAKGELYGIAENNKMLYKINKRTASAVTYGDLRVPEPPQYSQSATFDPVTDKFYWAGTLDDGSSSLYEISLTNGAASAITRHANNEEFVGLYIPDTEANVPEKVSNLLFTPDAPGSLTGKISFGVPSKNINGGNLSGTLNAEILIEGQYLRTLKVENLTPGSTYTSETITFDKADLYSMAINVSNDEGKGKNSVLNQWVGHDVPQMVRNLALTITEGKPKLNWRVPAAAEHGGYIDMNTIRYKVIRDLDGKVIAEDITALSCEDEVINTPYNYRTYTVIASSSGGDGEPAQSNGIRFGNPYTMPFSENFATEQKFNNWTVVNLNGGVTWKYDKVGDEENFGPCAYYVAENNPASDWIISPPVSLKKGKHVLHYGMRTSDMFEENFKITVGKSANPTSQTKVILDVTEFYNFSGEVYKVEFEVSEDGVYYFGTYIYSFGIGSGFWMNFESLKVEQVFGTDLEITALTGPAEAQVGQQVNYSAGIVNKGSTKVSDYKVHLYKDQIFLQTESGTEVAAGASAMVSFSVPFTSLDAGKTYTFTAKIDFDADEFAGNNSASVVTRIEDSEFPTVEDVIATLDNDKKEVVFSWEDPVDGLFKKVNDGFESYSPFAISGIGDWTTVDIDQSPTFTIGGGPYNYPNEGAAMAGQIFRPKLYSLSATWNPRSGDQSLNFFNASAAETDDWLISPELSGRKQTISFYARTANDMAGKERFIFYYSDTDKNITSFVPVSSGNFVEVPTQWTKYEYEVPAGARYFAIRCVSVQAFVLLIDDVSYISSEELDIDIIGYNIYRNDVKLNENMLYEKAYKDILTEDGLYTYNVTAVYDSGESGFSESVLVRLGATGVGEIEDINVNIYPEYNHIVVSGAMYKQVAVYTLEGRELYKTLAKSETERFFIDTPGMYLVAVNGKVTKVIIP